MNTITATNTISANTTSTTQATAQATTEKKFCGMTAVAGLLFWASVFVQFLMVYHDVVDQALTNHLIYHILPLTGALAYFGLKKDMAAQAKENQATDC